MRLRLCCALSVVHLTKCECHRCIADQDCGAVNAGCLRHMVCEQEHICLRHMVCEQEHIQTELTALTYVTILLEVVYIKALHLTG